MAFRELTEGWSVTATSDGAPAGIADRRVPAVVPGVVHTDLHRAGIIDDPFDADNETRQQWIGRTNWEYSTSFTWTDEGADRCDVVAQGLDTIATVELNGHVIGQSENQHRSYRFDATGRLVEGQNSLVVRFEAPVEVAEAREIEHGELPNTTANPYPYNTVRKMASSFGWDWGPVTATSGIWKPIGIDCWSAVRIAAVRPLVGLDGDDGVLTAHVDLDIEASSEAYEVVVDVAGVQVATTVAAGTSSVTIECRVPAVELWWPVGYGAQPLYDVVVRVRQADGRELDSWTGRVGFRSVELDTTPDEDGTPFLLKINGVTVLVRGANWIPDHAFPTEVDRRRYTRRLTDATDANINLLRVWGGGIFESVDFYAECDERGILVWQDFLFACAAYAEEAWLAEEVAAEATEAITRLSQHASLVIWNGNNENIWGYVDWHWRPRLVDKTWGNGYYRDLLPALIAKLDPTRPYSPGSPYSFGEYIHPNDPSNGTTHIWDVWNTRDYLGYRAYRPRFVSEFGFQGPPAWSTLTSVVHDEPLDPYGVQMLAHQKARDGNAKLDRGMAGHLPKPESIEDWHWATQLNQAHAIRFGVEHFRSLTPHNTGMIVWQLNDTWPVISWAAVDFDERRKPMWYALRDAYAPRLATIQPRGEDLALLVVNDRSEPWSGSFEVTRRTFDGSVRAREVLTIAAGARAAVQAIISEEVATPDAATREFLVAEPLDPATGPARALWNYRELVDQELLARPLDAVAMREGDRCVITLTAHSYVRDLTVLADRVDPAASVSEAMVTLLPGETHTFSVIAPGGHDPDAFLHPLVMRSANDLTESRSHGRLVAMSAPGAHRRGVD